MSAAVHFAGSEAVQPDVRSGYTGAMRIAAALAALFLLATPAPVALYAPHRVPAQAFVRFEPVPLVAGDNAETRLGALRYVGGWTLTSNDPRFGGLSALHVRSGEGIALSDRGFAMTFALPGGRPVVPLRVKHLRDGPEARGRNISRDSESLIVAGNEAWVGYERTNSVWRYRLPGWSGEGGQSPAEMRHWPENGGAEAMVRLADGRFLVFSERSPATGGGTAALLFEDDPADPASASRTFSYRAPDGFRITDAAQLGDGRLVLLHRRIWMLRFTATLTIADIPAADDDVMPSGREIGRFAPPAIADNMEALSVTHENGRDTIWVASDDNFSPLQRTLLLKFELEPDRLR